MRDRSSGASGAKKCRQVLREYHRMTGLLRFQSLLNQTMYAAYQPDAHLTPLLAGHFSRRFQISRGLFMTVSAK